MSDTAIIPQDSAFLREAATYLERPRLLMRLANLAGRPLEGLAQHLVPKRVVEIAHESLRYAMSLSASTVWAAAGVGLERDLISAHRAAGWTGFWHKLAAAGSGGGGGFLGLPGLALELPVTTGIMFRSIASIAADFGEDVREPAVRLECLTVFSHGGFAAGNDAMESTYLTTRLGMAQLIENAAQFVARESAEAVTEAMARGAAPPLLNFIGGVAAQFNVAVSEKWLAQGLPVLGGLAGAFINAAFAEHFNAVACYHFGIRKLERRLGSDVVQAAYRVELDRVKEAGTKAGLANLPGRDMLEGQDRRA
jgi:EcsC protein family